MGRVDGLTKALDEVLDNAVSQSPPVPGVAAVAVDRAGVLYAGARGVRDLGAKEAEPFTLDTVCAMFSTTKAVGSTACLQLAEAGLLDLDAPAENYVPRLGAVQVVEGIAEGGEPRLRPPKRAVTTRHLLTHTSGFGYDTFNEVYRRLRKATGRPPVTQATWASLETPLLFDPGEDWAYGSGIDWAGMVVEAITGKRLGAVLEANIFRPLEMHSTAFTMTPGMRKRRATMHTRKGDGSLSPNPDFELPQAPELHMAGHGLYGTALDYASFIRMWLNDGAGPGGARVLRPETVAVAARNHLPPGMVIKPLRGVNQRLANDFEFFPGVPKSWSLGFMVNEAAAPTGRAAGSLAWAGLANLYYWIDRTRGVGGIWATQIFPFGDKGSMDGFLAFERTIYRHRKSM